MGLPKISIIWLNFNSMRIFSLVLESLKAISELDYPYDKYELIVVDNGSTDGSIEKIEEFLKKRENLRKKIVRLNKNLGFTGGNNVGFKARDKESKYIVLLNNDAVPFRESLKTMVEYAEQYNAGGLNGIILKYEEDNVIDTAGDVVDELLCAILVGRGKMSPWVIKKPFYITYADGAFALYKIDCILKSVGEKLFFDEFFGYGDDIVLGLSLWNYNCRVIAIPKVVAKHRRGSTFAKYGRSRLDSYLLWRNRVALSFLTNTRYKHILSLYAMRSSFLDTVRLRSTCHVRTLYDGVKLGKILRERYNLTLDIYKAPMLKLSLTEVVEHYLTDVRGRLERFREKKIAEFIRAWEVD